MITFTRGFPVSLLPHMRHLMGKRREDHFVSATGKIVRIEGELMDGRFIDTPAKPFRGKVASRIRVPLQCHQHLGQAPTKQFPIEKIVGSLESLVFSERNNISFHNCIVPYNSFFVKN